MAHKKDFTVMALLCVIATMGIAIFFLAAPDFDDCGSGVAETARKRGETGYSEAVAGENVEAKRAVRLFVFDPNTAPDSQLRELGLTEIQIKSIHRFRQNGGFHHVEQFAKVRNLTKGQYDMLLPYITIGDDFRLASDFVEMPKGDVRKTNSIPRDTTVYPYKLQPGEKIVLNQADTSMLKKVPGVGSAYARTIYNYGMRLGGYVSVDQIDEIPDLPTAFKQYMTIENPSPERLNVNRLSVAQLRRHPYFNFYMAQAIVRFRAANGPIQSLEQLRLLPEFPDSVRLRIAPYVTF